jgi:hypothetical protein
LLQWRMVLLMFGIVFDVILVTMDVIWMVLG